MGLFNIKLKQPEPADGGDTALLPRAHHHRTRPLPVQLDQLQADGDLPRPALLHPPPERVQSTRSDGDRDICRHLGSVDSISYFQ